MNSDFSQAPGNAIFTVPKQLSLFPFDPWGAQQVFAVLERPHPGIARAMIGPLSLGDLAEPANYALRCLAVSTDGDFAACINICSWQLRDQVALWQKMAYELDAARRQPIPATSKWLGITPHDCLKGWSATAFWIPPPHRGDPVHPSVRSLSRLLAIHELATTPYLSDGARVRMEKEAGTVVFDQISVGVRHVLSALKPEIFEFINMRSRISISLVHNLMTLAKQHGPSSEAYMLQALKTEALAVLHLAASGYPEKESIEVRDAILSGRSLPDTLAGFGVAKPVHRRSLRKLASCAVAAQDANAGLSELPLSGSDWLTVMRLIKKRPFQQVEDWKEFCNLVKQLTSLEIKNEESIPKLLRWCLIPGYKKSSHRLECLTSKARSIKTAVAGLASMDVPIDDTISLAMEKIEEQLKDCRHRHAGNNLHDAIFQDQGVGDLVIMTSLISGKSIAQLMKIIFDAHPGIPGWFQMPTSTSIQALHGIEHVVGHGIACSNCLQDIERAIEYVSDGLALYAVKVGDRMEGTIALRVYKSGASQQVLVREVSGVNNADPSPELSRLAQDLADSWRTEDQMVCWAAYDLACERWKQSLQ